MDYKKIVKDGTTYHLINTNRFKSISIVIFLTKEFDKDDVVFSNLLASNLVFSSKKYNSKSKIASIGEDLYGAKVSASSGITGSCSTATFSVQFVNPKYTDEKYMDLSLDFFREVILNPNVENGEFNKEYFDIVKSDAIAAYENIKDNAGLFASIEFAKVMNKGTPLEYSSIPSTEEINRVTPKNLYEYYQSILEGRFRVDVCIHGEVDESIVDRVHDIFKVIKSNGKKYRFLVKKKPNKKVVEKIDCLPFNQSRLYMGYVLDDMSFHEITHVLRLYNTILGSMNDSILFNIVREEHSLCYSIGSYYSRINPTLTIYAGINKSNYEKSVKLIKECVNKMSDRETLERLFDSAKKTINTAINTYYDDVSSQVNRHYNSEFDDVEDIELTRESINKVTIDEIIEINKKIHLDTIYLLKGDNN